MFWYSKNFYFGPDFTGDPVLLSCALVSVKKQENFNSEIVATRYISILVIYYIFNIKTILDNIQKSELLGVSVIRSNGITGVKSRNNLENQGLTIGVCRIHLYTYFI